MIKNKLPPDFIKKCESVTAKRPRTVIAHILKYGHITTQELKDQYGYNHPPRAARDVREKGIPLETFRVEGSDGRKIGAYRFGDPQRSRFGRLKGRTAFSKKLKKKLIEINGSHCAIYLEEFNERDLQIDHRIPFEVAGDDPENMDNHDSYMLLYASANRAKSCSCEHCVNWLELKKIQICLKCYWAYPEDYEHIAMCQIRRVDIIWSGDEVNVYEKLKKRTQELQKNIPEFIKEILKKNL
jgi:hypothetical protein